ncbi:MAG: hypothetical protein MUQ30_12195 [Anaerolineae bacterium]|nr:hypothetical protein [Anaerolineae bacterium]
MDYGRLLRRAWDIIWAHKFLILLGLLVALVGTGGSASGTGFRFDGSDFDFDGRMPRDFREFRDFPGMPEMPQFRDTPQDWGIPVLAGIVAIVAICIGAVFGLALWGVSTTARGGLISGVDTITAGGTSSFGQAFGAGWQRIWQLLGIGIAPAIPGLLIFIAGLGMTGVLALASQVFGGNSFALAPGVGAILIPVLCILVPIALVLNLLRTFANRACMLEDLGVFAAYKRGLNVLIANIGPAIVLFVIQIGINIALGLLMLLPGLLMALCCILWPVLIVIEGTKAAYFSALWTLAWKEWTAA